MTRWSWLGAVLLALMLGSVGLFLTASPSEEPIHPFDACEPTPSTELALDLVADGFAYPVDIQAPRGDPRLFIVEQSGKIRVIDHNGKREQPFLDLSGRVETRPYTYDERGLLGLAFHPDFARNGRFFVNYTVGEGPANATTRISEFKVSSDPNVADPKSEARWLEVVQPYRNHNGGGLAFGNDGRLYVGLGDGGASCDAAGTAQNPETPLGKMLRFNVDLPPGQGAELKQLICADGLRNPWRFAFDRSTGDLYIGDVGQDALEEIDVVPAGRLCGNDFGWPAFEGSKCPNPSCPKAGNCLPDTTLPAVEYGRDDGCSVTGGYVYRGSCLTALSGAYFYADWCNGWIRSFKWDGKQAVDKRAWKTLRLNRPSTFGQDSRGELYVASHEGAVYRIAAKGRRTE